MTAQPLAIPRPNAGNWRSQVDALLTPKERELVGRLTDVRAEVMRLEHELAELRNVKRAAGVVSEVEG